MYGTRGLNSLHHFSVLLLIASFIVGSLGNPPVKIKHREVKSVVEIHDYGNEDPEIPPLKNLCKTVMSGFRWSFEFYHLDEEYELRAQTCTFEYQDKEKVTKPAIICSTVPSIYLVSDKDENTITAITVKSDLVDSFKIVADTVTPTTIELMPKNGLENNPLAQLCDAERQNVCIKAKKHGIFIFTDSYVLKPHTYEYQYQNGRVNINAMPCPSYPPTYIRPGQSENELIFTYVRTIHEIEIVKEIRPSKYGLLSNPRKIVSFQSIDDHFTGDDFQKLMNRKLLSVLNTGGRQHLCALALNKLNYTTDKLDIPNAADFFEFDHGNGLKVDNYAVPCFRNNDMFVYMEKVTKDSALVKVLLHRKSKFLLSVTKESKKWREKEKFLELSELLSRI